MTNTIAAVPADDQPADDQPSDQPADQPADEQSTEQSDDKPVDDQPSDQPADDQSTGQSDDRPAEASDEPADGSGEPAAESGDQFAGDSHSEAAEPADATSSNNLALATADSTDGEADGGGGDNSAAPAVSLFPDRFTEPSAPLAKREKLNAALSGAIDALPVDDHSRGLSDMLDLPIAIVALDDDGSRPLSGQHHFEMFYSGSLLKVAPMYAAFQLRAAVNDLAATSNFTGDSDANRRQLFRQIRDTFNPQIKDAVPRINNSKTPIKEELRVPKYEDIFTATFNADHYTFGFKATSDPKTDFAGHLRKMIVGSHNDSAGFCIRALGYSWINGVLQAAGFFDDSLTGREGIWLAGDYGASPTVEIASVNDKMVKQATTCFHMAWLFVQLFDRTLVQDNDKHPALNLKMQLLLIDAVDDPNASSLLKRFSVPFTVLQSKIGVGNLKVDPNNPSQPGSCIDGNIHGCVFAEAAILQHSSGRKFVAVWQNVLDGTGGDIRRIAAVIQKTMDAYVA